MHQNHKNQLFLNSQIFAFLDNDVLTESIPNLRKDSKTSEASQKLLNKFEKNKNIIQYLPITPEKGVIDMLESDPSNFGIIKNILKTRLDINTIINDDLYKNCTQDRKGSKKKLSIVIQKIIEDTTLEESNIKRIFYKYYAENIYPNNALMQMLGPVFRESTK